MMAQVPFDPTVRVTTSERETENAFGIGVLTTTLHDEAWPCAERAQLVSFIDNVLVETVVISVTVPDGATVPVHVLRSEEFDSASEAMASALGWIERAFGWRTA